MMRGFTPLSYVVGRFKGETFSSAAIRTRRQCGFHEFDGTVNWITACKPASILFADHPSGPHTPAEEFRLIGEVLDATSWPLISLLQDWDVTRLLRFGTRYMDGFPIQQHIRFCPECTSEQRRQWGISWWLRDLNLPHVFVCPIHEGVLHYVDRRAMCDGDGHMPHELERNAQRLNVRLSTRATRHAAAIVLLCQHAPHILSSVLLNDLEYRSNEVDDIVNYVKDEVSAVRCHGYQCYGGIPDIRDPRADRLTLNDDAEWKLGCFAALSTDPLNDVKALVRASSRPVRIPHKIDELAFQTVRERFKQWNKRSPDSLLTKCLINILGEGRSRDQWFHENFLALLMLHWLCPHFLSDLPIDRKTLHAADQLKGREREAVWYAIYKMAIDFDEYHCHPARSIRILFPLEEQPINSVLGDSFLRLVLWHGQEVLQRVRWCKSQTWRRDR